jgi:hypothetical protein
VASQDLPGGEGSVLDGRYAEKVAQRVVERKALYVPRDEEIPPPGVNWYEHNWSRAMPVATGVRVQLDIKEITSHIEPFVLSADVGSIVQAWRSSRVEVDFDKNSMLVSVKILPK